MATVAQTTFSDALDRVVDFLGSNASPDGIRAAKRAVLDAYRQLSSERHWHYFYTRGRITTAAPQSTGTITYVHTGGTYERQLTLTSATWPTWARYGVVVISNTPYEVAERKSSTVLTLSVNSNPGADVAAGTTYSISRDTYPLPTDFQSLDALTAIGSSSVYPEYVHPRNWLTQQRIQTSPGTPRLYTIMGEPNYMGALALRFFPGPDAALTFDFVYSRRARPILINEYKTGTVTTTASSATVTGSGTTFSSNHIGSILRVYDATNYPTGLAGAYPALAEKVITDVASATSLTVDSNFDTAYSAVKYLITDPIDVEEGAMLDAFHRCCELHASFNKKQKDRADVAAVYQQALRLAFEADSRVVSPRAPGMAVHGRLPLKYHLQGEDIS